MSEEKKIGISNSDRAHVLVQAMPYIKKWAGETIVVKYGGNAMINPELKEAVMNDIVLMQLVGVNVVLVHGGGPEISGMLKKIGKESRFVGGMRYTDAETMDIVQQVLAGKVNKDLVQLLENTGGKAVGLCGLDGSMLKADKLPTKPRSSALWARSAKLTRRSLKMSLLPATHPLSPRWRQATTVRCTTSTPMWRRRVLRRSSARASSF